MSEASVVPAATAVVNKLCILMIAWKECRADGARREKSIQINSQTTYCTHRALLVPPSMAQLSSPTIITALRYLPRGQHPTMYALWDDSPMRTKDQFLKLSILGSIRRRPIISTDHCP